MLDKKSIINLTVGTIVLPLVVLVFLFFTLGNIKELNEQINKIYLYYGIVMLCVSIGISVFFVLLVNLKSKKEKHIISKYKYLIGSFDIEISEDILFMRSIKRDIKLNLQECLLSTNENLLTLQNKDGFKILIPIKGNEKLIQLITSTVEGEKHEI